MGKDVIFAFQASQGFAPASEKGTIKNIAALFAKSPGIVRIPDAATVHIRLEDRYFEPETLLAMLRKILCKKQ